MKPMNPQDRPKVIAMLVITVILFGFILKTILGTLAAKNGNTPQPAPPPVVPPTTVATNVTPPGQTGTATSQNPLGTATSSNLSLYDLGGPTDPFRKVLPDPSKFNNPTPPPTTIKSGGSGRIGTGGGSIPLPPIDGQGSGPLTPMHVAPPEPTIRLDGVFADKENLAMVTVGSMTDTYRAGSKIAKVFEVVSIDELGASFRGPSGTFRLEVGQEHHAPAAPVTTSPLG